MKTKTKPILLKIPQGMLKKIDSLADKERRSRTAQLLLMLENELKTKVSK